MSDVLFLSSVFNDIKIAEPMGTCILAASLRKKGFDVEILEPSLEGWSVEKTVQEVVIRKAIIVGISMLRDKNVKDILEFCILLRKLCPDRFICVGGHGPSIAVNAIDASNLPEGWNNIPHSLFDRVSSSIDYLKSYLGQAKINKEPIVNSELTGQEKGAGEISSEGKSLPDEADSPYFDKSRDYLRILKFIDTYMLGESDENLPILVERVLNGEPWQDIPGLAYLDEQNRLIRNPPPSKIKELDKLPHMARDILAAYQRKYGNNIPASILASRGCFYNCTFCSVVQYEQLQPGPKHRQRPNKDIVAEITSLYKQYGVTYFNFEDDNFIIKNRYGIQKLHDLCERLMALDFKVNFTFFCRADAVSEELFRRLKEAGLAGIYFGIESVYAGDLEFFHKGVNEKDNAQALDILLSLGFSLKVGSELRIMLGYITWHPLTSFESLRATSRFVQRYEAPPKLLRRKLRLYSATEIVAQTKKLGLLDPNNKDGWNFKDARIAGLDLWVDNYFGMVNKTRDKLRTIEKAADHHGYPIAELDQVRSARLKMDQRLYEYFDNIVQVAAGHSEGAKAPCVAEFDREARQSFSTFIASEGIKELIIDGYAACGFTEQAIDIFRK